MQKTKLAPHQHPNLPIPILISGAERTGDQENDSESEKCWPGFASEAQHAEKLLIQKFASFKTKV